MSYIILSNPALKGPDYVVACYQQRWQKSAYNVVS